MCVLKAAEGSVYFTHYMTTSYLWYVKGGLFVSELIKVSAQSRSTAVAGAIAGVMREHGYAEMQAIGASAVNQAIKAIAIAAGTWNRTIWT